MDVSIIIIVYKNSPETLRACFESIAKSEGVSWELIVVDNAGDAQTIMHVSSVIPRATCIINTESDAGISVAMNQALKRAQGRYILVLDPEVSFAPNMLADRVAYMDAFSEIGATSSVIRYSRGEVQESIRRFPTLRDQIAYAISISGILRRNNAVDHYLMRDADLLQTQDVDSVATTFLWMRKEVIDSVGLFDERFTAHYEGEDYGKRIKNAGWKIRHVADGGEVQRDQSNFSDKVSLKKQRLIRRSMRKYFWKHEGFFSWLTLWVLAPVFVLCACLGTLRKK